ncbi:MAG: hypothetical protein ACE5IA_03880 [Dehalococcoidia bacterium]
MEIINGRVRGLSRLARAVLGLRESYPRWGKDRLVVLLREEDWGELRSFPAYQSVTHV